MKYEAPGFEKGAFTCPHCGVYAQFHWVKSEWPSHPRHAYNGLQTATCGHCKGRTVWFDEAYKAGAFEPSGVAPLEPPKAHMLWPLGIGNAPLPHEDMPDDVKNDYLEARAISELSPRGAAALLRLSIQRLCKHLGETGENINDDIGSLVKKGLPVSIQRALDVVRVTGNNAVHPGELRIEDNPTIVAALFGLVNLIVDNRIAEPKRIKALYESLPKGALQGIEKRDG